MVEMDTLAVERLELLSNTAMLKKVLDRKDPLAGSRGPKAEIAAFSRYEKPSTPIPSVQAPPASPESMVSDRSQRGETPSPHMVVEATRDSPPTGNSYRGDPNKHAHHQQEEYHHYHGASGNPFRYPEGSQYPPFPTPGPHHGYMHGPHMDRYFSEHRAPGSMAPLAPHPQGRMHPPYTVKENVAPPPFRSYEDRRSIPGGSHHTVPGGPSRQASTFFSPAVSVSDDVEDNAAAASRLSNDALARENFHLRDQLQDKDTVISSLQQRVHQLETQINELRQLPTGKISHIPIE